MKYENFCKHLQVIFYPNYEKKFLLAATTSSIIAIITTTNNTILSIAYSAIAACAVHFFLITIPDECKKKYISKKIYNEIKLLTERRNLFLFNILNINDCNNISITIPYNSKKEFHSILTPTITIDFLVSDCKVRAAQCEGHGFYFCGTNYEYIDYTIAEIKQLYINMQNISGIDNFSTFQRSLDCAIRAHDEYSQIENEILDYINSASEDDVYTINLNEISLQTIRFIITIPSLVELTYKETFSAYAETQNDIVKIKFSNSMKSKIKKNV